MIKAACTRAAGSANGGPRSGRCRQVQWILSVVARSAGDADVGGFDALDMASSGSGAEGHASKVRAGIVTQTVTEEDRRTPTHLLYWDHWENILHARQVTWSTAMAGHC